MSIEKQIERILSLEEDYDDEGSKPVKKETADKVVPYIKKAKALVLQEADVKLGEPHISIYNGGSIDIFWKSPEYTLLLNIPEEDLPASYYGDDNNKGKVLNGLLSLD